MATENRATVFKYMRTEIKTEFFYIEGTVKEEDGAYYIFVKEDASSLRDLVKEAYALTNGEIISVHNLFSTTEQGLKLTSSDTKQFTVYQCGPFVKVLLRIYGHAWKKTERCVTYFQKLEADVVL